MVDHHGRPRVGRRQAAPYPCGVSSERHLPLSKVVVATLLCIAIVALAAGLLFGVGG